MKTRRTITIRKSIGLLRYIPLVLWVAFWCAALGWIIAASFSTTKEIFSNSVLASGFHLENYTDAWKYNNVSTYFKNSLMVTGISCVLVLLIACPASYVLAKKKFFGERLIMHSTVTAMSIPQVMLIIPIYIWFIKAKLVGHLITLIILYTTLNVPYTVFYMTAFFSTIPSAFTEAAMIDGCNPVQTYFKIVFPIMKPTAISVAILETMWVWNDYLLPYLVLKINKYKTIQIAIQYLKGGYGAIDMGAMMAMIVLAIIPIILFYGFCQKYIIEGVISGAVKG